MLALSVGSGVHSKYSRSNKIPLRAVRVDEMISSFSFLEEYINVDDFDKRVSLVITGNDRYT